MRSTGYGVLLVLAVLASWLIAPPAALAQSNFVMECTASERLTRIVVRTDPFDHIQFFGVECSDGAARRIMTMGHEGGTRHEVLVSQPIVRVAITRGTCVNDNIANMVRVCSVRFEFEDGTSSPVIGGPMAAGGTTVLDGNGEVYGFHGFFRMTTAAVSSGPQSLGIVTRKLAASSDPTYDLEAALEGIRDAVPPEVMGYAVVIRNPDGGRVGFARSGWAVHPLDETYSRHARQYDTRSMAAAGSTNKAWASAVAALRVDESIPGDLLAQPLGDVLPERWRLHARFQEVTILDVIKHRAGFRHAGPSLSATGGAFPAWYRLRNGERWPGSNDTEFCGGGTNPAGNPDNLLPAGNAPPYAHCYSNSAGGMFHFILAHMANDSGMNALENQLRSVPIDEYNDRISAYTANFYEDYVRRRILDPAGAVGSCDMSALVGVRPVALAYSSSASRRGFAFPWGACASGGWIISTEDLSKVLHAIARTDRILTLASRQRLFDLNTNRRVWDIRTGSASTHNGGRSQGAYASVVIMINGYVAAMSWTGGSSTLGGKNGSRLIVEALDGNRR